LEFAPSVVSGCSHFHLANPFAMPRMRPEAGNTLERARAAGMTTSLDTGWDALNQWMKVIGPCLPHLDLLFVNGDEARMLSGHSDPRTAAQCFRDRGVRNIVIKVGSRGCLLCDGCESVDVPGFPVTAVDTTGAGDCFAGAFLVALQRGLEPMEAARLANAIGALTVQHPGATTGLRDFESTTQWMRSFGM
jgi:sugar/nucleoside kinase (ribokinase family)